VQLLVNSASDLPLYTVILFGGHWRNVMVSCHPHIVVVVRANNAAYHRGCS